MSVTLSANEVKSICLILRRLQDYVDTMCSRSKSTRQVDCIQIIYITNVLFNIILLSNLISLIILITISNIDIIIMYLNNKINLSFTFINYFFKFS